MNKHIPNNTRFGRLTVQGGDEFGASYICRCSCGNTLVVKKNDLLSCRVLSCGQCQPKNNKAFTRSVFNEYGSVTDFDYGPDVKTCSYCGRPEVWARGLCKNCYARYHVNKKNLLKIGYDGDDIDEYALKYMPFGSKRSSGKVHSKHSRAESLSPSSSNKNAEEMLRLYTECNMTYAQIANVFGISRQRVYQILHSNSKTNKNE